MTSCEIHDDCVVVHEGRECPYCMAEKELASEVERLENELSTAKQELKDNKKDE